MSSTTGAEGALFRSALDLAQGGGHPLHERLGDVVAALLANDDPQFGFEVVGIETGWAVVEVTLDQMSAIVGELSVEVVVQKLHSL